MKRFLIYTRHGKITPAKIINNLKINSGLILIFTLYICGIMIGTVSSLRENGPMLSEIELSSVNILFCIPVILFLLCFCSGLSCIGIPFVCFVPVITGFILGRAFTACLVMSGISDYFSAVIVEVISGIFISVPIIAVCELALHITAEISSVVIFRNENRLEIGKYIKLSAILFFVLLIGILIGYVDK